MVWLRPLWRFYEKNSTQKNKKIKSFLATQAALTSK
jgi:hypothetical protein